MRSFLLAAFLLIPHATFAASFDCAKASSAEEKTICRNPALGKLDEQLAASYQQALKQLAPPWDARLRQTQREWLKNRVADADPKTLDKALADAMQARIKELDGAVRTSNGVQLLQLHYHFALPVDKTDIPSDSVWAAQKTVSQTVSPLFIINDIPGSKGFNQWVEKNFALPDPKTPATEESGNSLSPHFVSPEFLSLSNASWVYFLGAAHPMSGNTQYNYWLAKGRVLQAGDVFSGRDWQKIILARVHQHLKKEKMDDYADAKTVADYVLSPDCWAISPKGLTIVIAQDAILFHAAGQQEISIPWGAFLGMLKPEFRTVLGQNKAP
ncbi:DUF3298 domain-containing protein [Chitinilyticum aquatile]|uniref:DUF3298 domain-containing protein n=1 Tax=Chitinilyticum aquatile TaxID=362520 RepID=UPI00040652A9|nr:DUF3298 domain-containing protein [Chitinilyticum aquatile]